MTGFRPTTLRDAKRLRLFPSVTSILGIFAKPQLDKWKMRQVALASMCLDRTEGESDDYFADRIIEEAFAQVEQAADLGSRIREVLEKHFEGVPVPDDLTVYTRPVFDWKEAKQLEFVERELCLVNKAHGFAGTMDVACRYSREGMGAIDFKTRKTKPGVEVMPYDGQAMQIAAYGATYWGEGNLPRLFGANVYISTTEPGRIAVWRLHTPAAHGRVGGLQDGLRGDTPRVTTRERSLPMDKAWKAFERRVAAFFKTERNVRRQFEAHAIRHAASRSLHRMQAAQTLRRRASLG